MKRLLLTAFIAVIACVQTMTAKETIVLSGGTYTIDTLRGFPIGPGANFYELRLLTGAPYFKRLDVFCTTVDLNNPTTTLQTVLGNDSILKGERPSNMARRHSNAQRTFFTGSNGDFYITSGDVGLPVGNDVINNEYARTPNSDRTSAMYGVDGKMYVDIFKFSGSVEHENVEYSIKRVNYVRNDNQLVLFNKHNGKYTRTNDYGTEVRIALCAGERYTTHGEIKVTALGKVVNKGNSRIEDGEMILSGHGLAADFLANVEVGDTLNINLSSLASGTPLEISNAVTGDPYGQMIKDGVLETENFWNENHPRTGIATTIGGDSVIFCVVDGRGTSNGCNTLDLGRIMMRFGAWNGVNLDGGGSSSLYVQHFDQVNNPSDGSERAVANGIFAVSNTPEDNVVAKIEPYVKNLTMPRYTNVTPKFLGYNQYGVMIDTLLQGVVMTCDASLGVINADGSFTATGTQNGRITLDYKGIESHINVFITTVDGLFIDADTIITDHNERRMTIKAVSGSNLMGVDPSVITYTAADDMICEVRGGNLVGLQNGVTTLYFELDGKIDSVYVNVEIPEEPSAVLGLLSDSIGYEVKSTSSKWETTWNAKTATTEANISFTYTGGRAPFVRIEREVEIYSIPDSITMTLNTEAALAGMQHNWHFLGEDVVTTGFDGIKVGVDTHIRLYSEDVMGEWNQCLFPITSESFNFSLQGSELEKDEDYRIFIKDITVHYKNVIISSTPALSGTQLLSVYPNPIEGAEILNISVSEEGTHRVRVYDVNGRVVVNKRLTSSNGVMQMELSELVKGTYIIKVEKKSTKIIIK